MTHWTYICNPNLSKFLFFFFIFLGKLVGEPKVKRLKNNSRLQQIDITEHIQQLPKELRDLTLDLQNERYLLLHCLFSKFFFKKKLLIFILYDNGENICILIQIYFLFLYIRYLAILVFWDQCKLMQNQSHSFIYLAIIQGHMLSPQ